MRYGHTQVKKKFAATLVASFRKEPNIVKSPTFAEVRLFHVYSEANKCVNAMARHGEMLSIFLPFCMMYSPFCKLIVGIHFCCNVVT